MTDAADRLEVGQEATVRYESSYISRKVRRYRGVFLGQREQDGSLTFWVPDSGYRSAPADADVTIHRKRKLPIPKSVRHLVNMDTGRLETKS